MTISFTALASREVDGIGLPDTLLSNSIPDLVTDHHPSPTSPSARAVAEAGHLGDLPLVERGFAATDPKVRAVALTALHRLGRLESAVLADSFADKSAFVRRRAAELAARIDHPAELENGLVGLLADEDVIAEVAAFSLGEIGSEGGAQLAPTTVEALERQALEHRDALCREAAVAALGALHTGLDTILRACDDKATVRRRAVLALAPFDGPEVDAALHKALSDRDWQVRQAAEDLLGVEVSDDSDRS